MTNAAFERLTVDNRGARQRLDRYLAQLGRWGSRARVQRLIAAGGVQVDGQHGHADTVLKEGQRIEVTPSPPETPLDVAPEAIALEILHEDDWILVINKPPGMVVHPAPGHWRGTLVSGLLHHWLGTRPGLDPTRPGIVHRLDKDTSGVMVIAKDADTLEQLAKQFRDRVVEKQYVAAVWGRLRLRRGTIAEPIGRNPVHRKRMAVRSDGREAMTTYEVIGAFDDVTLLRLFPKTGRTHQLRVHLAAIGHPIVGDAVYGRARRSIEAPLVSRQALHAERIRFQHPHSGKPATFTAPLAPDLRQLWQRGAS